MENIKKEIEFTIDKKILAKYLRYFIIGIIVLILLPIIIYWIKFGSTHLSDNFKDWTDFASYINSFISPLFALIGIGIAIVNIIVLYQLTQTAKKIEEKNIATQLRKEEYVQIKKEIDSFIKEDKFTNPIEIKKLIISIDSFVDDYEFLFPNLKDNEVSEKIFLVLEQLKNDIDIIEEFIDAKNSFLQYIQSNYLLNTKKY